MLLSVRILCNIMRQGESIIYYPGTFSHWQVHTIYIYIYIYIYIRSILNIRADEIDKKIRAHTQ